jgi:hypothetical protein
MKIYYKKIQIIAKLDEILRHIYQLIVQFQLYMKSSTCVICDFTQKHLDEVYHSNKS